MSDRHGYPQPQPQQQHANGEAPGSPPSALSFLHGMSEEPLHGEHAGGGVDSMPGQGGGPDAIGMSARCAAGACAPLQSGCAPFSWIDGNKAYTHAVRLDALPIAVGGWQTVGGALIKL
jgi:hypothetical protein